MSEEEKIIDEFKEIIYNPDYDYIILKDEEGFTQMNSLLEDVLDLYNKEKEKNKKWEDKINEKIEEL